jgi:hypothetical protein
MQVCSPEQRKKKGKKKEERKEKKRHHQGHTRSRRRGQRWRSRQANLQALSGSCRSARFRLSLSLGLEAARSPERSGVHTHHTAHKSRPRLKLSPAPSTARPGYRVPKVGAGRRCKLRMPAGAWPPARTRPNHTTKPPTEHHAVAVQTKHQAQEIGEIGLRKLAQTHLFGIIHRARGAKMTGRACGRPRGFFLSSFLLQRRLEKR